MAGARTVQMVLSSPDMRGGLMLQPRKRKLPLLPQPQSVVLGLGLRGHAEFDDLLKPGNQLALDVFLRTDIGLYVGMSFAHAGLVLTVRPIGAGYHWEEDRTQLSSPRLGNFLLEIDVSVPLYRFAGRKLGPAIPTARTAASSS